jgi:hypothetical protein
MECVMTRILTIAALAAALAAPAFAEGTKASGAIKEKPAAASQDSKKNLGEMKPAAGPKRQAKANEDAEHRQIVELNLREAQRAEAEAQRR